MRKQQLVSDIKRLIKECKSMKQCQRTFGMLDAYEEVLSCIENHNKPREILPSGVPYLVVDNSNQE